MNSSCRVLLLVAGLAFAGCGKKVEPPPPAPVVSGHPETIPDSYVGNMVKAQQLAIKTIDVTSLNNEVQLFNAQEGRFPKDLNELVTTHYIGALPEAPVGMKLVYDATQGKVSAVRE
jgi:hypothetical protein